MATRAVVLQDKDDSRLPADTIALLHQAAHEGLCELVELRSEEDYRQAARELQLDEQQFFYTMIQVSLSLFISEWVGPNVQNALQTHASDSDALERIGMALGETVLTLHQARLIAGDTHLKQFVVRGDAEEVNRIDLVNVYSLDEVSEENRAIEHSELLVGLRDYWPALEGFLRAYPLPNAEPAPPGEDPEGPPPGAPVSPPTPPAQPSGAGASDTGSRVEGTEGDGSRAVHAEDPGERWKRIGKDVRAADAIRRTP